MKQAARSVKERGRREAQSGQVKKRAAVHEEQDRNGKGHTPHVASASGTRGQQRMKAQGKHLEKRKSSS